MSKPLSPEKRQEWKENILKQRESGTSIERWCNENNIAPHNFYYWRDKLFPKTSPLNRSCFTELIEEKRTWIVIEYKDIRIHLDQQFSPSILKRCLEVLKEIKC